MLKDITLFIKNPLPIEVGSFFFVFNKSAVFPACGLKAYLMVMLFYSFSANLKGLKM